MENKLNKKKETKIMNVNQQQNSQIHHTAQSAQHETQKKSKTHGCGCGCSH